MRGQGLDLAKLVATEGERADGRGSKLLPTVHKQAEKWHEAFGSCQTTQSVPPPTALHLLQNSREISCLPAFLQDSHWYE